MLELTVICALLIALVAFLLIDRRSERREHAAERQTLLQRIQAPEAAVRQHEFATPAPDPEPVPFEDDEAFHATREEMAEALRRG